jgi:UDP-N-acetylglucosamine--N-acetylmuramyl-(pentapeptide) pyrophosphoryl-undecaprenol N-acetylglucosamine transferase
MHKPLRIIIAGGGTGGHIFPAIAVAQAIQKLQPNAAILFVGAKGKMEMEKVPHAGYKIIGLTIAGLNRSNILKNWSLPFKLVKSFFQVSSIFNKFKPNVVFGVGGYSSFPVLKYAQTKNIPTFIHESNAFAGKSNILLGQNATIIFTGTKGMEKFFPTQKIMVTGNPVRKNIIEQTTTKATFLLTFGLLPTRKTLLIIGGSLGAASINKAIKNNLAKFVQLDIQLIWQTGKPNANEYMNAAENYSNVYVNSFIDDMSAAYCASDIVVSRSGAMAVAEICISGKPCVFVPYPFAAEDHQTFNAMTLVNEGAAFIVKDQEVEEKLIESISRLVNDEALCNSMENKIKAFASIDADDVIAKTIINHVENSNSN